MKIKRLSKIAFLYLYFNFSSFFGKKILRLYDMYPQLILISPQ